MAKRVESRNITLVIELRKDGTNPIEVTCRADYEVSSDDLTVNRSFQPTLTLTQKNAIKTFGVNIVSQIKTLEE